MHQQWTMTQPTHAATDHAENPIRRQRICDISSDKSSHVITSVQVANKRTVYFRTMSGICGRAIKATRPREAQRHGTLWTIKHWRRLAHYMPYVRYAAFFDTLAGEFLMRRREQREMKNKKSNVANLLEAQWARGKLLPRGCRGTPWKKAPNDCDHPPTAIQKGSNAAMYYDASCVGIGGNAFP